MLLYSSLASEIYGIIALATQTIEFLSGLSHELKNWLDWVAEVAVP